MAKGKLRNNQVGFGYQITRPFDIVSSEMGDLRAPTLDRVDYERNLGLWDMGEFGFGPGKPYPKAVNIEDKPEGV